jgi:hypothetical protein
VKSVSKIDAVKFANSGLCTVEMVVAGLQPHYDGSPSKLVPGWTKGQVWSLCRVALSCLSGPVVPNSDAASVVAFAMCEFDITFEEI